MNPRPCDRVRDQFTAIFSKVCDGIGALKNYDSFIMVFLNTVCPLPEWRDSCQPKWNECHPMTGSEWAHRRDARFCQVQFPVGGPFSEFIESEERKLGERKCVSIVQPNEFSPLTLTPPYSWHGLAGSETPVDWFFNFKNAFPLLGAIFFQPPPNYPFILNFLIMFGI